MKSMTGFGSEEMRRGAVSLSVEIKSYNGRFLDIFCSLPPFLSPLEKDIRDYIGRRCRRGKIEAAVRIKEAEGDITVSLNRKAAAAYYEALELLARSLKIREKPGLSLILSMEGVLERETNRDGAAYAGLLNQVLEKAFEKFEAERVREGRHTKENILGHLQTLENSLEKIAARSPELERTVKENLRSRFTELLGDLADENRILAETAVQLVKYTIAEELARLKAHLDEFRAEAERGDAPGKKLDFLSQEINREINTIGSKTPMLDISREVVIMKDALENIREQLRNVE
jgi:uncharacterized protein (TIGR00255 family)